MCTESAPARPQQAGSYATGGMELESEDSAIAAGPAAANLSGPPLQSAGNMGGVSGAHSSGPRGWVPPGGIMARGPVGDEEPAYWASGSGGGVWGAGGADAGPSGWAYGRCVRRRV